MSQLPQSNSAPAGSIRTEETPPSPPPTAITVSEADDDEGPESPPRNSASLPLYVTPRQVKISTFDVSHKDEEKYIKLADREMEDRYATTDLDSFFDRFVPRASTNLSRTQLSTVRNFSGVPHADKEDLMYAPLCDVFKALLDRTKSSYTVLETSNRFDKSVEAQDMKPDLSLYDSQSLGRHTFILSDQERKQSKITDEARRKHLGRTSWAWMTSFIEVKSDPDSAPFNFDNTGTLEIKDTDHGKKSRAQVVKYVSEIMLRQHRTFVLCAFIWRDWVRFMRWDRAGVIVSAADNYVKSPRRLVDFIHRVSSASPEGQGYDPTVTVLDHNDPEVKERLEQVRAGLESRLPAEREMFDAVFVDAHLVKFPLYKLTCPDVSYREDDRVIAQEPPPSTPRTYTYWIGKYHAGTRSPTGRGMKGYIAIDIDHGQLVFLKDYWCPKLPSIHPEPATYFKLREASVPCVPTVVAAGEVLRSDGKRQVTLTQAWLERHPGDGGMDVAPESYHLRFVVKEIGMPLETYKNSFILVVCIAQAVEAHRKAYENAKILHRDVSANNIIIDVRTGGALLIDWDLARHMGGAGPTPDSSSGRSGTWRFMSAQLLLLPRKPNELADDPESFVYVLCIMALCYHKHNLSPTAPDGTEDFTRNGNSRNFDLSRYIRDTFDSNATDGRYFYGGESKYNQIKQGKPDFGLKYHAAFAGLISNLYLALQARYETFDLDQSRLKWGLPKHTVDTVASAVPMAGFDDHLHADILDQGVRKRLEMLMKCDTAQVSDTPSNNAAILGVVPNTTPLITSSTSPLVMNSASTSTTSTSLIHNDIVPLVSHATFLKILRVWVNGGPESKAQWPIGVDKTYNQFFYLPDTAGTYRLGPASSYAGSSAGGSMQSLAMSSASSSKRSRNEEAPPDARDGKRTRKNSTKSTASSKARGGTSSKAKASASSRAQGGATKPVRRSDRLLKK